MKKTPRPGRDAAKIGETLLHVRSRRRATIYIKKLLFLSASLTPKTPCNYYFYTSPRSVYFRGFRFILRSEFPARPADSNSGGSPGGKRRVAPIHYHTTLCETRGHRANPPRKTHNVHARLFLRASRRVTLIFLLLFLFLSSRDEWELKKKKRAQSDLLRAAAAGSFCF